MQFLVGQSIEVDLYLVPRLIIAVGCFHPIRCPSQNRVIARVRMPEVPLGAPNSLMESALKNVEVSEIRCGGQLLAERRYKVDGR